MFTHFERVITKEVVQNSAAATRLLPSATAGRDSRETVFQWRQTNIKLHWGSIMWQCKKEKSNQTQIKVKYC